MEWTKDNIIDERLQDFLVKLEQTKPDTETEGLMWNEFEYECEVEAFERNKENELNYFPDKAIEQSQDDEISVLSKKWLELFKKRSFCNEIPGKILFRILLSCALKSKIFYTSNNKILKSFLHFFWISNSGTGKDQAIDFLEEAIQEINNLYILKYGKKLINSYMFVGTESIEALLDSFPKKKTKGGNSLQDCDFEKVVPGIFSKYDLIISRECSFLFREMVRDKQQKREFLLVAMEGRDIPKRLIKWEDNEIITRPNFCFIGCSRPIENMKQHIANSGLQQRAYNYCREVDSGLRKRMLEEMTKHGFFGNEKEALQFKEELKVFASEFVELIEWSKMQDFIIEDVETINKIIFTSLCEFYENIINENKHQEHKLILESFIARFKDMILVLSYQNAILRKSNVVTKADVQLGIIALQQSFRQLTLWLEETIEESLQARQRHILLKNSLTYILREPITRKELVDKLSSRMQISKIYAYKLIQNSLRGNNSLLIKKDRKVVLRE